jgi:uncharacterized protein DUF2637
MTTSLTSGKTSATSLLWAASLIVLIPVAGIGAGLSFRSLYEAAVSTFGARLAFGFPLLVDMLILGTSLAYLAGLSDGCPRPGWRWSAHGGVLGTLVLNALAAPDVTGVAWHITAPAVWSVLVEMTGRQVTAGRHGSRASMPGTIPVQLWITSPLEAVGVWRQMAGTNNAYPTVRTSVAAQTAALQALRIALPRGSGRQVRRVAARHLRSGTLAPEAILRALNWPAGVSPQEPRSAREVLSAVLNEVLLGASDLTTIDKNRPTGDGENPPAGRADSGRRTDRSAAVLAILRDQPDIDGPGLTRELSERGWTVSVRTATRILASTRRAMTPAVAGDAA